MTKVIQGYFRPTDTFDPCAGCGEKDPPPTSMLLTIKGEAMHVMICSRCALRHADLIIRAHETVIRALEEKMEKHGLSTEI